MWYFISVAGSSCRAEIPNGRDSGWRQQKCFPSPLSPKPEGMKIEEISNPIKLTFIHHPHLLNIGLFYLNITNMCKVSSKWYFPLAAKLFNSNFHSLEVVSRWRDPQLQVSENYSDLTKLRSSVFKYCWMMSHFIFNMFKRWYLMS